MSTLESWLDLAQIRDDDQRVAAWAHYEMTNQSVFDVYYSAWGDPARRAQAAVSAPTLIGPIQSAEVRARNLLAQAVDDFREHGLLTGELHVVLLVGGHSSNGWVAEHEGQRTLFLALEYLGSPPFDDLLVVHELSHVTQAQLSPAARHRTNPAALAVMLEGAATATARALRPDHSDSAYLWMDEWHVEWLDDCDASRSTIARLLMENLDTPDHADAVAPLLRNRGGEGVPPRSGYWVGDLIARELRRDGYDLKDLLSVGTVEAHHRVRDWAFTHRSTHAPRRPPRK